MVTAADTHGRVLVIGGTGQFGARICRRLARHAGLHVIVTSRDAGRAANRVASIRTLGTQAELEAASFDHTADDAAARLAQLAPDVVIHTAGPFQGQDYGVARACIAAGSHYVDLADGRDYVAGIAELDAAARAAGVTVVTGGSTLPGISSAVINDVRGEFAEIHGIEMSIAPGHRSPRGIGTIRAVLSYCGKPFKVLRDGEWRTVHGWQDLRMQNYPDLGRRISAACDVPDFEVLPRWLPELRTVRFHAALEAPWETLALWLMAVLTRIGAVRDWSPLARAFAVISDRTAFLGTDRGGMHIGVDGMDASGNTMRRDWYLTAEANHGPEVPCTPSIIVARKLLAGDITTCGAFPCLGLITVDELLADMREFSVAAGWQ